MTETTTTNAGPGTETLCTDKALEMVRVKDDENDPDSKAKGEAQNRFPAPKPYKLGPLSVPNYRSPYTGRSGWQDLPRFWRSDFLVYSPDLVSGSISGR